MTHFTRVSTVGPIFATFSPEFLVAAFSRLSVRQEAAEGRVESIIFRYCCLARLRMAFKSLSGIEVEFDVSSFCPGQTQKAKSSFWQGVRFWFLAQWLNVKHIPEYQQFYNWATIQHKLTL